MKQLGQNTEHEYGTNKSRSCRRAKSAAMFGGGGRQIQVDWADHAEDADGQHGIRMQAELFAAKGSV
jgi:hypothetical protein